MKELEFGLIMTVVGMGGTFLTLGLLIAAMHLMKKIFPYKSETQPVGEKK
ncbi:MAG: OadG family protein [Planctomycetes bacterium]|nr:OadG family protein [Planctomycetota bacterium]